MRVKDGVTRERRLRAPNRGMKDGAGRLFRSEMHQIDFVY